MKNPETPAIVPLPELANYTDEVVVRSLGLPQGFDESQLGVNLAAFSRIQKLSGLGCVSIEAASSSVETNLSGINLQADGTASAGIGGMLSRQPKFSAAPRSEITTRTKLGYDQHPETRIFICGQATNQKLTQKDSRAPFDPKARAKALNHELRLGLHGANTTANLDIDRLKTSLYVYAVSALMSGDVVDAALLHNPVGSTLLYGVPHAFNLAGMMSRDPSALPTVIRAWRKSLFVGISPDRLAFGAAAIASSRFIVAQEAGAVTTGRS